MRASTNTANDSGNASVLTHKKAETPYSVSLPNPAASGAMRLTFLGTCAGTEPMPGRHHTSFTLEHDGRLYWFDAGAGCSHTAHLLGLDLLSIRAIFISHPHMDHVGGLGNLLWDIRKLNGLETDPSRKLSGRRIDAFLPDMEVWEGFMQVLRVTEGNYAIDFELGASRYRDGQVFAENGLCVTALHNQHLGDAGPGSGWRSFSLRAQTDDASLVYSGDIGHISELDSLIDDGCDLLLMETGHHQVEEICAHVARRPVRRLGFLHHGRAILADPDGELRKARSILDDRVFIADDGMTRDL